MRRRDGVQPQAEAGGAGCEQPAQDDAGQETGRGQCYAPAMHSSQTVASCITQATSPSHNHDKPLFRRTWIHPRSSQIQPRSNRDPTAVFLCPPPQTIAAQVAVDQGLLRERVFKLSGAAGVGRLEAALSEAVRWSAEGGEEEES